jgi:hypothetical protein
LFPITALLDGGKSMWQVRSVSGEVNDVTDLC